MGMKQLKICGGPPVLGTALAAANVVVGGVNQVRLTWGQAFDENSGEKDVIRYVVWRRKTTDVYGDPLTSVAAGQANYTYFDNQGLLPATTYEYRLAAQDCSPKLSSTVTTTIVTP
jgi:hypothetical protein